MPEAPVAAPVAPAPAPAPVSQGTDDSLLVSNEGTGNDLLIPAEPSRPAPAAAPVAKAEAPPVVEKPVVKEPPVGYQTEEAFRKFKGTLDRRNAETERKVIELTRAQEATRQQAEIEGYKRGLTERFNQMGIDPATAGPQIDAQVKDFSDGRAAQQRAKDLEAQNKELTQQVEQVRQQHVGGLVSQFIATLARDHGIKDQADLTLLNTYARQLPPMPTPTFDGAGEPDGAFAEWIAAGQVIADLAVRLADRQKFEAEAKKAKLAAVPNGTQIETAGGAAMSDAQYVKASNAGRIPFDAVKLQDAMRRMGTLE